MICQQILSSTISIVGHDVAGDEAFQSVAGGDHCTRPHRSLEPGLEENGLIN